MNNWKILKKQHAKQNSKKKEDEQERKVPVRKSAAGAGEHYKVKDRR